MDSSYHHVSALPHSSFLYYTPDIRHSGFSQDQHGNLPSPIYHSHISQSLQPTSTFSPSEISNSNIPLSQIYHCAYSRGPSNVATPSTEYHKTNYLSSNLSSNLLVDTKIQDPDLYYYPSTPPLSASRSITSSPPDYNGLTTPINAAFAGVNRVKEINIADATNNRNWTENGSPPVTPVFIQPSSLMSNCSTNDMLSAVQCSLLSPSPSPFPNQPLTDGDLDFCDPRQLTMLPVTQTNSSPAKSNLSQSLTIVPTFCVDEKSSNKELSETESIQNIVDSGLLNYPILSQQLQQNFGPITGIDTEEEFVNGLVNFPLTDSAQYFGAKRHRIGSGSGLSINSECFFSADEAERLRETEDSEQVATACPLSPPSSGSERESKRGKKLRKPRRPTNDAISYDLDLGQVLRTIPKMKTAESESATDSVGNESSKVSTSQSGAQDKKRKNENRSDMKHNQAPATRRGRKQSMTEDPSKTFLCELCPQRFRRQEHLKRHFRSLHTEDRPFECQECGKKFSRSDNLSQHARTHGSGAIVMGLIEGSEMHGEADADHDRIQGLGSILYRAAAATSGSDTGCSSQGISSGDDAQTYKKRKRSE
ncbi:C2H2 finger domain transcription factor sebA [Golovinomyces cichoracearum]|uniref:C2H2 finger domain transcription factor sebA n=1 Tax=Golovinomyces cichoracearum TaxID=62708 RepID=A0A420J1I8_9PEZI|nr:C2H2 finger domain transcription factor sebA [Golovinomyces cichoracearum]